MDRNDAITAGTAITTSTAIAAGTASTASPAALAGRAADPSPAAVPADAAGPAEAVEVAVIGLACRFPGADTPEQFWRNLRDGVESITFLTPAELAESGIDPAVAAAPNYVPAHGVVEGSEQFDAGFFGYAPREAQIIDPQQRWFLECAWEALESAGYRPADCPGVTGVFAGATMSGYLLRLHPNRDRLQAIGIDTTMLAVGNDKDSLAPRVAYKLNLRGPAVTVQTACSTSLVAVHMACQSLLAGETDLALAGAVSLTVPMKSGYLHQEEGILSPDGHCRAFDARAAGTVFGCGLGIVVLKRLADALADGDTVHAVIKGSAVNNDGATKAGFTAPSVAGQAEVIAEALANAGLTAGDIGFVEAHGTATALGDPVEVAALTRAFRRSTQRSGFCALGSVKTNVGHLEVAAGMAGLFKAILAVREGEVPPSLHFERPNPQIDFAGSPFYVNTELTPWPAVEGRPRRAGVSSFGFGGTNAHVVVEQPPPAAPAARTIAAPAATGATAALGAAEPMAADPSAIVAPGARSWQLLVLSARHAAPLAAATRNLAEHLAGHPGIDLAAAAHTLQTGRQAFEHRRAVACRDAADAVRVLRSGDPQRLLAGATDGKERQVCFLFPGQGAQHPGMARTLYLTEPEFRRRFDHLAELFQPHLDEDLRSFIVPPAPSASSVPPAPAAPLVSAADAGADLGTRLERTDLAQAALFAVEIALAGLLQAWGIRPRAMAGHSIGELVAACLAGVFTVPDAVAMVALRGRLMRDLPAGAMLAVPLPEAEVAALLGDDLALAAVQSAGLCVVSGTAEAADRLAAALAERSIEAPRLHTSHAFHSAMMDPVCAPFAAALAGIPLRPPQIPFVSNVTGRFITAAEATDPAYWSRHLRQTVRLADGLGSLLARPGAALLEVGPAQVLAGLARQHPARTAAHVVLSTMPHPKDPQADAAGSLCEALAGLWVAGVEIDWEGYHSTQPAAARRRVPLPTYPFEHQRFWIDLEPLLAGAAPALASAAPASFPSVTAPGAAAGAAFNAVPAGGAAAAAMRVGASAAGAAAPAGPGLAVTPPGTASPGSAASPASAGTVGPAGAAAASGGADSYVGTRYAETADGYVAPEGEIEEVLADIWQTLLGVPRVGSRDNFFRLNGNSLIALQAISRVQAVFGVKLTVRSFFETPTVAELSAIIAERQPGLAALAEKARLVEEVMQLSAAGAAAELRALDTPAAVSAPLAPAAVSAPALPLATSSPTAAGEGLVTLLPGIAASGNGKGIPAPSAITSAASPATAAPADPGVPGAMRFSLFFFSGNEQMVPEEKYRLIVEGAKFADRHGFTAIWTPERHFHSFGGLYPNPSVLSAALAMVTERLELRAGSVVLPLHHPLRVAEEWSIVDNLSRGRAGISFASGFHPNDFAFSPGSFANRRQEMFDKIALVRRLWRGEAIQVMGGAGNEIAVEIFPKPVRRELPVWVTCSNDPWTFEETGRIGANVLTSLIGLTVDKLAERIALYRASRARHGHDPAAGEVAVMVHTFVGTDLQAVKETVRAPFCGYLRSHTQLLTSLAKSLHQGFDPGSFAADDLEELLAMEFERYFASGSLLGTPESCLEVVRRLRGVGVDEVGCLLDFGVAVPAVMDSLVHLDALRRLAAREFPAPPVAAAGAAAAGRPEMAAVGPLEVAAQA